MSGSAITVLSGSAIIGLFIICSAITGFPWYTELVSCVWYTGWVGSVWYTGWVCCKDGKSFFAFEDKELRYRKRYMDLIVNPDIKNVFIKFT